MRMQGRGAAVGGSGRGANEFLRKLTNTLDNPAEVMLYSPLRRYD